MRSGPNAGQHCAGSALIINVTPFEPEWEGFGALDFSNTTPLPAKIDVDEGCAQVLCFARDEVCQTRCEDRDGKYQGQRGATLPKASAPSPQPERRRR